MRGGLSTKADQELRDLESVTGSGRGDERFTIRPFNLTIVLLSAILLLTVLGILYEAGPYYVTPLRLRYRSELHPLYKPGGGIGHPLGVAGSALLIILLSYSIRKRVRFVRGWGLLSRWLQFHIFCGIAGPILIVLHTSFKMRGIVAISFWSMVIVFLSGVIGRYLYAQIPHALSGGELQYQDLIREINEINSQLELMMRPDHFQRIQALTGFQSAPNISKIRAVFLMISDDLRWFFQRRSLRAQLRTYSEVDPANRERLEKLIRHSKLQSRRIALLKTTHELFRHWHVIHLPLAQTMYLTMAIHIVVALMTGYF